MAIGVTETAPAEALVDEDTRQVLGLPEQVEIPQAIRVAAVEFRADGTIAVAIDYHRQVTVEGAPSTGGRFARQEFVFGDQPQPPDPPVDELDPETGEVVIPAGARFVGLPSAAQLLAISLPVAPTGQEATVADITDLWRQNLYELAKLLNPDWAGAPEV